MKKILPIIISLMLAGCTQQVASIDTVYIPVKKTQPKIKYATKKGNWAATMKDIKRELLERRSIK
ncbi:MAG: hypothetical protein PHI02_07060 [Sulfurovaceae bacterium]|nr:hypothetical protein [Sulfurovaceae bacterium]